MAMPAVPNAAASPGLTLAECQALDHGDPLDALRSRFAAGAPGRLYLDANSLGPMPVDAPARAAAALEAWSAGRSAAWGAEPWIADPLTLGAAFAPLLGARPADVLAADTTTVNLFKMVTCAWALQRSRAGGGGAAGAGAGGKAARRVILTDRGNFPTDQYVLHGLDSALEGAPEIQVVEDAAAAVAALDARVAVLTLSHGDYRSGVCHDMPAITAAARAAGVLTVWDCSHTAGAVPVDLMGAGADFAVACGYKYLSGGPGCPALLWVHPGHQGAARPLLAGWMGHRAAMEFDPQWQPADGISRHQAGTPAVLANAIMAAAAAVFAEVPPAALWARQRALSQTFVTLVTQQLVPLGMAVLSPADPARRAGHVALSHPLGAALAAAFTAAGVVCSFRPPHWLRFGLGPLALSHAQLFDAVARMRRVLEQMARQAPAPLEDPQP